MKLIIKKDTICVYNQTPKNIPPLHHHFEKLGWHEQDIVKLFWVLGLILAMGGIFFGVWL